MQHYIVFFKATDDLASYYSTLRLCLHISIFSLLFSSAKSGWNLFIASHTERPVYRKTMPAFQIVRFYKWMLFIISKTCFSRNHICTRNNFSIPFFVFCIMLFIKFQDNSMLLFFFLILLIQDLRIWK